MCRILSFQYNKVFLINFENMQKVFCFRIIHLQLTRLAQFAFVTFILQYVIIVIFLLYINIILLFTLFLLWYSISTIYFYSLFY